MIRYLFPICKLFFQNLATSDLIFVTVCIPPTAISYAVSWPFGDVFCRIVQYLIHASCYGSVITLILLSLDRYLAVVYPVKSISWRTVCNTSIIIFVSWVITLAFCTPILFVYNARELRYNGDTRTICRYVFVRNSTVNSKLEAGFLLDIFWTNAVYDLGIYKYKATSVHFRFILKVESLKNSIFKF